jgi:hypothetical protein
MCCAAYAIYIAAAHNALPVVYVPVLVVGLVFALLVLLSTIAAKQRSCRCLLPMGSAIGIFLALGEVFLGIAAWAKPATVDGARTNTIRRNVADNLAAD